MPLPDALLFDCDGVILDSNRIKSDAFLAVTQHFGADIARRFVEYHQQRGGISRHVKFAWLLDELLHVPTETRAELLADLTRDYGAVCARELLRCPLIPGVEDLLRSLPGGLPCYVVTGGDQAEVRHVFAQRGLAGHFTQILGSPTSKRDHMLALAASGALRGHVVYFGDAELDMRLAEEFGCSFVFVYGASEWNAGSSARGCRRIVDFTKLDAGEL